MVREEFKRKKIDALTLGERMKKIRSERRLSLIEISRGTKIQVKYLEYLENGEYHKMPADVYVRGFLKSYAEFTGINEKVLFKLYDREKSIHRNIKKIDDSEKRIEPLKLTRWIITPQIMILTVIIFSVLAGFFYLYREINAFISSPQLVILYPQEAQTIETNTVTVKGITEKESSVFINDQAVLVNDNGEFSQEINLQKGLNPIVIKVKNKFDKITEKSLSVNAKFEDLEIQLPKIEKLEETNEENGLIIEISVKTSPSWLSVETDGNLAFSGILNPETVKKFEAREKISITSAKGNQTYLKINGKDTGILSQNPGMVKNVEFFASKKY